MGTAAPAGQGLWLLGKGGGKGKNDEAETNVQMKE